MPDQMSEQDLMELAEQHDKARGPFDPPCACEVCREPDAVVAEYAAIEARIVAENAAYEKRVVAEGMRFDQVAAMLLRTVPGATAPRSTKPLELSPRGREILTTSHEGNRDVA